MKCTYIYLQNVQGIYAGMGLNKLEIHFDNDNMFNLIAGANGSGKSTFANSIDPFSTENIREGKKGKKELHYIDKKERFIIRHFYEPTKSGHSVKMFITKIDKYGVEKELNPNGTVNSFKELVELHMGVTPETITLLRLGTDMNNIIKMTPSERKKYMSHFTTDTDIYLGMYKKINGDCILVNKMVKNYADKLDRLGKLDKIKEELDDVESQLSIINDKDIVYQAKITSTQKEIQECFNSETLERFKEIEISYKKNTQIVKSLIEKFGTLINEDIYHIKDKYNSIKNSYDTSKNNVIVFTDSLSTMQRQLSDLKERLYDVNIELDKFDIDDSVDIENEIKKYTKIIKDTKDIYDKYNAIVNYINDSTLYSIQDYFDKKAQSLEAIYSQLDFDTLEAFDPNIDYSGLYIQILNDISNMNAIISSKESELETIDKVMKDFTCNNIQCPLLRKAFSGSSNKIDIETELNTYRVKVDNATKQSEKIYILNQLNNLYSEIINYVNTLHPFIQKQFNLKHEKILQSIRNSRAQLLSNDLVQEFLNIYNTITTYTSAIDSLEQFKSLQVQLDSKNNYIKEKQSICNRIDETNASIQKIKQTIDVNQNSLNALEDSLTQLDYLIKNKSEFDRLDSLVKEYNDLKERKEKFDKLNNVLVLLTQEAGKITSVKNSLLKERDKLFYKKKEIKNILKQKKVFEENYADLQMLRDAISTKKGIPLVFVQLYLEKTRELANKMMKDAYDNELELGKFVIDEKEFRIPLLKRDTQNKDISKASSGERAIAALAISLAIIEQNKSRYNILTLDELDGPLDKKRRRLFLQLLERQMKKLKIKQVFNITHNNLFNDYPLNLILFKDANVDIKGDKTILFEY